MLHPGAKNRSLAPGFFHNIRHVAARARKQPLKMAHGRLMPVNLQALAGFGQGAHIIYAPLHFINANLPLPLERRERLGHKGRKRGRYRHFGRAGAAGFAHLAA